MWTLSGVLKSYARSWHVPTPLQEAEPGQASAPGSGGNAACHLELWAVSHPPPQSPLSPVGERHGSSEPG